MINQMGKITSNQRGLIQVWTCSCKQPSIEIDETTVQCLDVKEYGMFGCGAVHHKGGDF